MNRISVIQERQAKSAALQAFSFDGQCAARTRDLLLVRQALYQLS
jgi:hypothetical protein